jgi:adenosylmethionine-8-amino-7-oxononanoate aminotransferase
MQLNQITFIHDRRPMRFSGIYRCIFTSRPMLWLIDSDGFKLIDILKSRQLFLCGRQESDKTAIAHKLTTQLRSMGYFVMVIDEVKHEVHLEQEMLDIKRQRIQALEKGWLPHDLIIYCCQNNFLVPAEYRSDMILLNN